MSKKKKAFAIRTDLALEACEMLKANEDTEIDGIVSSVKENKDTSITCVDIINEQGSKAVGKPIGKYITIEDQGLRTNNIETKERIIEETTKALKLLLKKFHCRKCTHSRTWKQIYITGCPGTKGSLRNTGNTSYKGYTAGRNEK